MIAKRFCNFDEIEYIILRKYMLNFHGERKAQL